VTGTALHNRTELDNARHAPERVYTRNRVAALRRINRPRPDHDRLFPRSTPSKFREHVPNEVCGELGEQELHAYLIASRSGVGHIIHQVKDTVPTDALLDPSDNVSEPNCRRGYSAACCGLATHFPVLSGQQLTKDANPRW